MSTSRVADLTVDELRSLIRDELRDIVRAMLLEIVETEDDPDAGLELKSEIAERLRRFREERPAGRPFDEVVSELGLDG